MCLSHQILIQLSRADTQRHGFSCDTQWSAVLPSCYNIYTHIHLFCYFVLLSSGKAFIRYPVVSTEALTEGCLTPAFADHKVYADKYPTPIHVFVDIFSVFTSYNGVPGAQALRVSS